VGSGIMGERLAGGNGALVLLVNTIATGAALVALICTFGPISGAHLNPAVSLADATEGGITLPEMLAYIAAQCTGGIGGTIATHLMFGLRWYSISAPQWKCPAVQRVCGNLRTSVRYLGMLPVALRRNAVCSCRLHHGGVLVHCFDFIREPSGDTGSIVDRYLHRYSTCRRTLVRGRVAAGALSATFLFRWLAPDLPATADQVLVPHPETESTRV